MRRNAFSLVELVIATSVLAILSTIITVNYATARRNARDGAVNSDARALLSAITSRQQAKGTAFVTVSGQPCTVADAAGGTTPGVGAGCTGMSGFGSGRAHGSSTLYGSVAVGDPAPGHVYASTSITSALLRDGYLTKDVTHPRNTNPADPTQPDFYVVYAGRDYKQSISPSSAQIVTVAVEQENATTFEQNQRSSDYFGAFETPSGPVDWGTGAADLQKNVLLVGNDTVRNICNL
jgi:prepilin-type N-terminal cleavage/methylation domain-containing protein